MSSKTVVLQLPVKLYSELEVLAHEAQTDPVTLIETWVHETQQRHRWQEGWASLRTQVTSGGISQAETVDKIVEQTRQVREDIFETEYAHLYR
jgi:hypothetical protein